MTEESTTKQSQFSMNRRDFLRTSAASAAAATLLAGGNYAFAQGSSKIRVGVIGCGGRGTQAAEQNVTSSDNVQLVALGDLFEDRVNGAFNYYKQKLPADKFAATKDKCFTGFDAYKKVIASGVDLVVLATPPGFRPEHLRAAVEAGKHVFMEKPVCVDGPGAKLVIESGEKAAAKGLGVVCGTQRRHQTQYVETVKRILDGAIGELVSAQVYWNQGGLWMNQRDPKWTDMEWQVRNWLYFAWLSGDHIVEQHVHNLDVMNWCFDSHPERALGLGGRQVRTDPAYGHIYDHFAIEYVFPGDRRCLSMCRQIDGTASRVDEKVVGTKGTAVPSGRIDGPEKFRWEGQQRNPYEQEHIDLIASIRAGKPLNEAKRIAESTLTAIMGRESCYTGKEVSWDEMLNCPTKLGPDKLEFGPLPVPPVAVPGKTQLVRPAMG